MNNKGVIQVKLLAIIFIIGILFFTVIPKTISWIEKNNKTNYVEVAKEYINEVKESINALEYKQIPQEGEALVVPLSNLKTKKSSPYGNFKKEYSYVIVINMGDFYEYYFAGIDTSNYGIPIVKDEELTIDSVVYGKSRLTGINRISSIDNLYIASTIFKKNEKSKQDDKNILLVPLSGKLSVAYSFKADTYKIYDELIKNIDTSIYNKEAIINNGTIRYGNSVLASGYLNDINGMFRYISFPNKDDLEYYASFVTYNKSYAGGVINSDNNYSSEDMIYDSIPTIVMNKNAKVVTDNDKKLLMWNMMAIYPDNDNYTITECGALIIKNNTATKVDITTETPGVMTGKSNNNCELGNIYAIRKNNININDRFFARGYIKYKDKLGVEHISYSKDIISALVKE